ncbi:MAG TPA: TrbI/VirB10 family protein [Vicinamibacterales bacterium]|nr:TrbI/VirB10 family protein [Vicinamibacterales bacterium]
MWSRPLAFATLAAGCIAAAAGGAYVATRHNATDAARVQMTADAPVPTAEAVQASTPPAAQPGAQEDLASLAAPAPADAPVLTPAPALEPAPARASRRRSSRTAAADRREQQRAAPPASAPLNGEPTATLPVGDAPAAELPAAEAPPAAAEPAPQVARFEEITIPSDTVIGVQLDTTVSSESARVEDRVEGHVTRDVAVAGRVAIPAGTKVLGSVTLVERGGKFKERSRIAVRFHTAQLPDGSRLALQTTAVMRDGAPPSRETAAKVGGSAVGGAILGAILGGAKGAVIGGSAGAGAGAAAVAAGGRNAATIPAGTTVSVLLMSDVVVTVER